MQLAEEKRLGRRKGKLRNESKWKSKKIVLKASIVTKLPRLCYKAEPGT